MVLIFHLWWSQPSGSSNQKGLWGTKKRFVHPDHCPLGHSKERGIDSNLSRFVSKSDNWKTNIRKCFDTFENTELTVFPQIEIDSPFAMEYHFYMLGRLVIHSPCVRDCSEKPWIPVIRPCNGKPGPQRDTPKETTTFIQGTQRLPYWLQQIVL